GTDGDECAAEIRVEHGIPVVILQAEQDVVACQPRVVHQDVDLAERLLDALDERRHRCDVGDVAREPGGVAADAVGHLAGAARVTPDHGDARTRAGERLGDRATDAARAARHERPAPREIDVHAFTSARSASTSAPVPQLRTVASGTIFLTSPLSTVPGPISTNSARGCRS